MEDTINRACKNHKSQTVFYAAPEVYNTVKEIYKTSGFTFQVDTDKEYICW